MVITNLQIMFPVHINKKNNFLSDAIALMLMKERSAKRDRIH